MDSCVVYIARSMICREMGGCAFLANENIGDGLISDLKKALESQPKEYLENLVNDQAGNRFRECIYRDQIIEAARNVLNSINSKT